MLDAETLATLLADPARAEALPPERLVEVLGDVERLRALLWTQLVTGSTTRPGDSADSPVASSDGYGASRGPDRLLTVDEAAEILAVDARWLYDRSDSLPFAKKLAPRTLRFSERGLRRWLETRP